MTSFVVFQIMHIKMTDDLKAYEVLGTAMYMKLTVTHTLDTCNKEAYTIDRLKNG